MWPSRPHYPLFNNTQQKLEKNCRFHSLTKPIQTSVPNFVKFARQHLSPSCHQMILLHTLVYFNGKVSQRVRAKIFKDCRRLLDQNFLDTRLARESVPSAPGCMSQETDLSEIEFFDNCFQEFSSKTSIRQLRKSETYVKPFFETMFLTFGITLYLASYAKNMKNMNLQQIEYFQLHRKLEYAKLEF